ncbi:hypothetical protein D3093_15115 (plasmid) [Azospirillum argentinense]|uniref:Uncharacterized protein n=1 Tax=Azospirillum argentinense TaxID=2970906 RepID=A0A4D8PP86_9PROT|nr:hypothetical protein [Azospirillum argentinense]QCN96669.1 hypothetical protein D3093_15115 [Azospirillum argentinense]
MTYPLIPPATPAPSRSAFRLRRVVAVATSPFTGQQQVQEHQGAWWEADISLPPMKRDKAGAWQGFLLGLRGRRGTFLMGDPDARFPRGVAAGNPWVAGAGQSGTTLVTGGWAPWTSGILRAGDYIELPGNRLHMVVTDVGSDGAGTAVLTIEPSLRSPPPSGGAVIARNARGLFRLASNDAGWDADAAGVYGFSFSCIEAL